MVFYFIVGESYVDLFCFLLTAAPGPGEDSTLEEPVRRLAGGSAVNTATHLAQFEGDNKVVVQTVLNADDEYGKLLIGHAQRHGFELVNCMEGEPNGSTPHTCVVVSDGDRRFMTHRGCARTFTGKTLDADAMIRHDGPIHVNAAGLFCTPGFGDGSLLDLLIRVRRERQEHKTIVSLVTQYDVTQKWDGGLEDLIPHLDFLIMNEVETCKVFECSAGRVSNGLEDWIPFYSALSVKTFFVVTLGMDGAVVFRNNTIVAQISPAVPVKAVDPTGAGDAFAAGFLYGLWKDSEAYPEGWPDTKFVRQALEWGCALGSAVVTVKGASVVVEHSLILEIREKQLA